MSEPAHLYTELEPYAVERLPVSRLHTLVFEIEGWRVS